VTGTNITNPSGGTLSHPGSNGSNGQGIGATSGSGFPNAQYALTLSLSAAGGFAATCQLTTVLVDVADNVYSPVGSPTYHSYGNPSAGSPSWFRPSVQAGYATDIASVSSSGLITGIAVGQCIVEVAFPTFDNTIGTDAQAEDEPTMFIYAQIIVTVIP
jgi:hypothetical protein